MEQKPDQTAHVDGSPVVSLSRSMLIAWALIIAILAGGIGFTAGVKTGRTASQTASIPPQHPLVTPPWAQSQAVTIPSQEILTPTRPQPSSDNQVIPSSSTSSNDVKEHMTFTKPKNWIERADERKYMLIYTTQDLDITIERRIDNPKQALDQVLHPLYPKESLDTDIKKTTVSGLEAVSFHYDFEGHLLTYVIAQEPNIVWQIDFASKNLEVENMHTSEINTFINSVIIK